MTKSEKKDVIYVISLELSRLYKLGSLTFSFPYESDDIDDTTDLTNYIEQTFMSIYQQAISQNWYPEKNLYDEQIYLIDTIHNLLVEYEIKNLQKDRTYNPIYSISESLKSRIKNVR